jgi:hypothetical protein
LARRDLQVTFVPVVGGVTDANAPRPSFIVMGGMNTRFVKTVTLNEPTRDFFQEQVNVNYLTNIPIAIAAVHPIVRLVTIFVSIAPQRFVGHSF